MQTCKLLFSLIALINLNIYAQNLRCFCARVFYRVPACWMYVRRGASTCDYEFMFRQHEAWLTNDPFHTLLPPWIHCRVCRCVHVCSWQCSNYCLREEPGPKRPTDVGGSHTGIIALDTRVWMCTYTTVGRRPSPLKVKNLGNTIFTFSFPRWYVSVHYISSRAPPPSHKWATLSSGCQAEHNGEQEAFGSGENEESRTLLLHSEALTRSFCPQTQICSANLLCSSQRFLPELSPPLVVTGKWPAKWFQFPVRRDSGPAFSII